MIKLLIVCLLLIGCAEPTIIERTVYKDVYVPQPCQINQPILHERTGDPVIDMLAIELYINEWRAYGRGCQSGI